MDKIIKYNFLITGIKYKYFNYTELVFFILNFINILLCYSLIINFFIDLVKNYKINKLLLFSYYCIDIFLLIYCNKLNFKKEISRNYDVILSNYYKKYTKIFFCISIILSLILSILAINMDKCLILNNNWNKNFNKYLLFFYTFYTLNLKFMLLIFFFCIFINLNDILKNFKNDIKNNPSELHNLTNQYIEIRCIYNKTISNFNSIFGNIIFFSLLPSFYIANIKFNNKLIDIFYIINFAYFTIFILIFHLILSNFDDNIKYLKSLADKNIYIKNYLLRKKNLYSIQLNTNNFSEINLNEISFKNFILNEENSQSIDWLIFSIILRQPLNKFEAFGFELNNSNILLKLVSLCVIILIGKEII